MAIRRSFRYCLYFLLHSDDFFLEHSIYYNTGPMSVVGTEDRTTIMRVVLPLADRKSVV